MTMVLYHGLGDTVLSGTVPGATFFIMSNVIIKGNSETIKQIYYLLNNGINNKVVFFREGWS